MILTRNKMLADFQVVELNKEEKTNKTKLTNLNF